MRIVYVLNSLAVGGTERLVAGLAQRMAARGHAVALVVLRPQEPDGFSTNLDVLHLDIDGSVVSLLPGLGRGMSFLRRFRPDLIHSHNFHGNMLGRAFKLNARRTALVSTIHNVYEGGWPRMLAYRLSNPLADRVTAVSEAVAERYVRLRAVSRSKCVVVTNGIETGEFVPDAERRRAVRGEMGLGEEFVWLTVGRNTVAKDHANLLQAFGQVWRGLPQSQLWIAGGDVAGGKKTYAAISMPHGALDHVCRLGLRRDIPALLDAADGFVLSSAWEGMPLAVGEAMAMEKPVVATDVGGVRELVGDAGVVVAAKDSNALAEAMVAIMRRPAEPRAELGRAARERILNSFSMDRKADEWEALYRSVLGDSGARRRTVVPLSPE
jgi:glycosyltransferase involved in cell wall biosynthesis